MGEENDDIMIWKNFLSGDKEAFSMLYRRYVQNLFRFGIQFTDDRELVKDCIHEAFLKIYKNRGKISKVTNVKIYLHIVLKNIIIDELRKTVKFNSSLEPTEIDSSEGFDIEEEYVNKELNICKSKCLREFMEMLNSHQRKIIRMRFVENMSIKDIAVAMDMKYQSVDNLIHRVIKRGRNEYLN